MQPEISRAAARAQPTVPDRDLSPPSFGHPVLGHGIVGHGIVGHGIFGHGIVALRIIEPG